MLRLKRKSQERSARIGVNDRRRSAGTDAATVPGEQPQPSETSISAPPERSRPESCTQSSDLKILDGRFPRHVARYVIQSALAAAAVVLTLTVLDITSHTALIAALGASAFIAFTMPHTRASTPRCMIGGYVVSISVGACCHYLSAAPGVANLLGTTRVSWSLFVALTVGAAMLGMVITNTEHAPAASVALGMMLNQWDYLTIAFILFGVCLLSLVKGCLQHRLKNLCASFGAPQAGS